LFYRNHNTIAWFVRVAALPSLIRPLHQSAPQRIVLHHADFYTA